MRGSALGAALLGGVLAAAPALAQDTPSFATLDADGDATLTREEFSRLARLVFDGWDASTDRSLSQGEIVTGLFTAWDESRDGALDAAEMERGYAAFFRPDPPSLESVDADGNGRVEGDELAAGLSRNRRIAGWSAGNAEAFGELLFELYDSDGDGGVSAQEYASRSEFRMVVGGFAQTDANGNSVEGRILTQGAVALREWDFASVRREGISAKGLLDDASVVGPDGNSIGTVWDTVYSAQGELVSVIVEVGGFWGMLETIVNVPLSQAQVTRERVTVPLTFEQMEDYGPFEDDLLSAEAARGEIVRLDYNIFTDESAFRGSYLIGDYLRMRGEGGADDGHVRVGPITDLMLHDARIAAVVVDPDAGVFDGDGYYALPFLAHGVRSRAQMYTLPYRVDELADAPKVEYGR